MSEHYIERCKCGVVLSQCRCPGPGKVIRVSKERCAECKAEQAAKPVRS